MAPAEDDYKRAAALAAAELVRPGMLLGLGTGSTARFFVEAIGKRVREGLRVGGVPTSEDTARLARSLGIEVVERPERPLDLAVDGADEIAPDLGLIKGRGGACTREKLVALAARQFVVIADESKMVERLGRGVLPVEVLPFLWELTARRLMSLGEATWQLRGGETQPFVTDNGNLMLDLSFAGGLPHPAELAQHIKDTPGVVEHGLFVGLPVPVVCLVGGPANVRRLGSTPQV